MDRNEVWQGCYRAARAFLTYVFGRDVKLEGPRSIVIYEKRGARSRAYWCSSVEQAAWTAANLAVAGADTYFHVAVHDLRIRWSAARAKAESEGKKAWSRSEFEPDGDECVITFFRGTEQSAVALPGLWADIDFGNSGHKNAHYPPDIESAMATLEEVSRRIGMPPTIVFATGGGLHAYWLFRELLVLANDSDRFMAKALTRTFTRFVGTVAAAVGRERAGAPFQLDATHDLARVLRVYGTWNYKHDPPRRVEAHCGSGQRYDPLEFEQHDELRRMIASEFARQPPASRRDSPRPDKPLDSQLASLPQQDEQATAGVHSKLSALLETNAQFRSLWDHEVEEQITTAQRKRNQPVDTSMSVYDFRIALAALRSGWSPEEVRLLLSLHYEHHGRCAQQKREDYFQRTIRKAQDIIEQSQRKRAVKKDLAEDIGEGADPTDGEYPVVSAATAPPPPAATRPIVRTAAEARECMRSILNEFVPGRDASRYICAPPDTGKTTAAGARIREGLASRADGFDCGVAAVVLNTRKLVNEKASEFVAEFQDENVLAVKLLGRSSDPADGWYCRNHEGQKLRAELMRSSCLGCPFRESCTEDEGSYFHDRGLLLQRVKAARDRTGPAILIFATPESLRWLSSQLPARMPVFVDDCGALFNIVREVPLRQSDTMKAIDDLEHFIESSNEDIPALEAARLDWEAGSQLRERAYQRARAAIRSDTNVDAIVAAISAWAAACGDPRLAEAAERLVRNAPGHDAHSNKDLLRALARLKRRSSALHPLLVARLCRQVLQCLHRLCLPAGRRERDARAQDAPDADQRRWAPVLTLPSIYKSAVRDGLACKGWSLRQDDPWPWEKLGADDGHDLRPAFTRFALDVAKEAFAGYAPVVTRESQGRRSSSSPELRIHLPDHQFISRARKGRVCWLAVAPMPAPFLRALNANQEVVLGQPPTLDVLICRVIRQILGTGVEVFLTLGAGVRRPGKPSRADFIVRGFTRELLRKLVSGELRFRGHRICTVGAVLHGADYHALERPPRVHYYGKDHAGTNDLAFCDALIVRRSVPPFSLIAKLATACRRALRLPDATRSGERVPETRAWDSGWGGDRCESLSGARPITPVTVQTCALSDPVEREMQRFHELHLQRNAIGRCRPFSNETKGRLVLFLTGRPVDWIDVRLDYLRDVADSLGIGPIELHPTLDEQLGALESFNERRAIEAYERQQRIEEILEWRPRCSTRELGRLLGVSERTVRRALAAMAQGYPRWEQEDQEEETTSSDCIGPETARTLRPHGRSNIHIPRVAEVSGHERLPSAAALVPYVRALSERAPAKSPRLSEKTIGRRLAEIRRALRSGQSTISPRRSDQSKSMRIVLDALEQFLAEGRTPAAVPVPPAHCAQVPKLGDQDGRPGTQGGEVAAVELDLQEIRRLLAQVDSAWEALDRRG